MLYTFSYHTREMINAGACEWDPRDSNFFFKQIISISSMFIAMYLFLLDIYQPT